MPQVPHYTLDRSGGSLTIVVDIPPSCAPDQVTVELLKSEIVEIGLPEAAVLSLELPCHVCGEDYKVRFSRKKGQLTVVLSELPGASEACASLRREPARSPSDSTESGASAWSPSSTSTSLSQPASNPPGTSLTAPPNKPAAN
ncbi:hypothetical protein CYMTET_13407, partial [Cymbomonas tetramitiformis]